MYKILITGANGYIGSRLSKYLSQSGYEITGLCFPEIPKSPEFSGFFKELILGDITKDDVLNELSKRSFDIIIHLISLDQYQSENPPSKVASVNVLPAWNLLNIFSKKELKKFIYFSTIHVYGKILDEYISEDFKPNPFNNYGLTHFLTESVCNLYNNISNTHCINIRLSNSYGEPILENANCWSLAINDLSKQAFFDKKIKLLSDGSPLRDFIHYSDVCQAIELFITSEIPKNNNLFHISSGYTFTIIELAHLIKNEFRKKYSYEIPVILLDGSISDNAERFNNHIRYVINNNKIKQLGFKSVIGIEQGIQMLFNYFENK